MRVQLLTLLFLLFGAAGCSSFAKDGQPAFSESPFVLRAGQTAGQTFVARDEGLSAIEVFLAPGSPSTAELRLHLRASATASDDLATASLRAQAVSVPGFYRFSFAPQNDSQGRNYYLLLDYQGGGTVQVGTARGDTYLDGALYENSDPADAQMAFRLVYDPLLLGTGLLFQSGTWLGIILVSVFLFVLPGWALLSLLWQDGKPLAWAAKLGIACGISLAIYPLFFLWTSLVGLRLGLAYALLPGLLAAIVLAWRHRQWNQKAALLEWAHSQAVLPDLAMVVVVALVVFTRFWVIRSLDLPLWGDSYHHTMIAQLMVDNGGLFESWQPYSDLVTFTYHFGFHSAVAVFHWLSGMPLPNATLWTGQILNVLGVLALYPLAIQVGKSRWAGVTAVLVGGLISPMPMFYANWGRYTQLAGQLILPGAAFLIWQSAETERIDWRLILLSWIAMAGLALTHYRILVLGVIFVAVVFLMNAKHFRRAFLTTALIGVGAGLLFLPWFVHMFAGKTVFQAATIATTPVDATASLSQMENTVSDVPSYFPTMVWLLIPLVLGWALLRRERDAILITIWSLAVLLATNPQWLMLPGEGALGNFTILIAAYIPVSVLLGSAFAWLVSALPAATVRAETRDGMLAAAHAMLAKISLSNARIALLAFAVLCATGVWGARQRLGDMQVAQHALATRPDVRAADWIQGHTPADARFLVNTFYAYGGFAIVGSDGGLWLPLLAHRQTIIPPLTYGSEQGPRPDYLMWINALPAEIQEKGLENSDTLADLKKRGITYVYVGQQQGRVNYDGPDVLRPEELLASSHFVPVYHQDRVWVFEIQ